MRFDARNDLSNSCLLVRPMRAVGQDLRIVTIRRLITLRSCVRRCLNSGLRPASPATPWRMLRVPDAIRTCPRGCGSTGPQGKLVRAVKIQVQREEHHIPVQFGVIVAETKFDVSLV